MESQFLQTTIEFAKSSGTSGEILGVATGDSLLWVFLLTAICLSATAVACFTLVFKKKPLYAAQSSGLFRAVPYKKTAMISVGIIAAILAIMLLCTTIANALPTTDNASGYAKVDEKITATVDTDNNKITLSSASFSNLQDKLSAGFDYVKTEATQDLVNANLKIWAGEQLVYDRPVGFEHPIGKYVGVKAKQSEELKYELDMDVQKALEFVGTSPITITTKVDALNTVNGVLLDSDGNPAANTMIQSEFVDENPQQVIKQTIYTDSEGRYTVENLKVGAECTLTFGKESEYQSCYKFTVGEDTQIPDQKFPMGYADVPVAKQGLVYDGTEQIGVASVEHVTLSGVTSEINVGTYTAIASVGENYV